MSNQKNENTPFKGNKNKEVRKKITIAID